MMTPYRFATYNVEWFTQLFDDDAGFLNDDSVSVRHGKTKAEQFAALGAVFRALNADGIMVIEAPDTNGRRSTVAALTRFAEHFGLRTRRAIIGYISETEQEIAFLYDPDRITALHDPMGDASADSVAPRFDYRLHVDGMDDPVSFSKPPLELRVQLGSGPYLRLIGVHAKSKAAHGIRDQAEYIRISIQNRRKQLAECFWLRARVDQILRNNDSLLVMGDLNDGPGLDEYEHMFGYSGVEVVTGQSDPEKIKLFDPHALPSHTPAPTTARFWDNRTHSYAEALIDFILASPDLTKANPKWRIWHPIKDAEIAADPALAQALLAASDHFPVTIDILPPMTKPLA